MRFEWDEGKRAANIAKHGVDLAAIEGFDFESAAIVPDVRHEYGEAREIALGLISTRLHVVVFTRRGRTVRIISLRKANAREVKSYAKFKK
jgi:uncharacterized protein